MAQADSPKEPTGVRTIDHLIRAVMASRAKLNGPKRQTELFCELSVEFVQRNRKADRLMKNLVVRLTCETAGQDLIEYALLGTLIALGCVIAMTTLGATISATFTNLGNSFAAAS